MKNKKGQHIFSVLLVFVVFVSLFSLVVIVSSKLEFNEGIGKRQFNLLDSAQQADEILFYLDKSVDIAKLYAVNETAARGGFEAGSDCGKYNGFNLWNCKEKESFPHAQETLIEIFTNDLNRLLSGFGNIFPEDNFHLYFSQGHLKGNAITPIVVRGKSFRDSKGILPQEVEVNYNWLKGGRAFSDFASDFAGTYELPYVWGGISPFSYKTTINEKNNGNPVFSGVYVPEKIPAGTSRSGQMISPGFDCSGFVWWSFRHLGLDVDRKSAEGYYSWLKDNGISICDSFDGAECTWQRIKEESRPGDLLFINPCESRKVCHIAIYTGDGTLAESAGGIGLVKRKIPENYRPGNGKEIVAVYRPRYSEIERLEQDTHQKQTKKDFVYDKPSTGEELIYSVYPSFVAESVNINIYDELRRASLWLIDNVKGCDDDLNTCIKKNLPELNKGRMKWEPACEKSFSDSLSNELNKCLETKNDSCYCAIDLPEYLNPGTEYIIEKEISEQMVLPLEEPDPLNKALREDKITKSDFNIQELQEIFNNLKCVQKVADRDDKKFSIYIFKSTLDSRPVYLVYNERVANLNVLVHNTKDDGLYNFYELPSTKLSAMFLAKKGENEPVRGDAIKNECITGQYCLEKPPKEYMIAALDSCRTSEDTLKIAQYNGQVEFSEPTTDYSAELEIANKKPQGIQINTGNERIRYGNKIYIVKKQDFGFIKKNQLDSMGLKECHYKKQTKESFCVTTDEKIPVIGDNVQIENLTYKFALYFEPKTI